jgi:hypothetical protein
MGRAGAGGKDRAAKGRPAQTENKRDGPADRWWGRVGVFRFVRVPKVGKCSARIVIFILETFGGSGVDGVPGCANPECLR